MTPTDPNDAAVASWLDAQRAGKRRDCEALLAAHPELQDFRADYELLDQRFAPLRHVNVPAEAALTLAADDTVVPEPPQPGTSFGDYDLLAEIARGGMGVVYKARQRSLNRIVALKMVLAGGHNAQRDRQRFLVEARAVARLNHPHVVPIYEVGEHAGQPYFTMELLTGGSLRERAEALRGDQRAIAQLMVTIARAIEHAHRRGLLHRDLKPSNVLLDEHGQPHVSDFGLAKTLGEESDLTQAGAIVGTPSYMAPEQATGQSDLTTAVDVYGLGAVLYELLTGRPPFKENTPLETLMRVLEQEPTAPRRLLSTIQPDLETICMKCLAKEPLARYSSAEALADDLERWLADRPIHARPVAARERVVKWARRQPLLASAFGGVAAACLALLVLAGILWQNAELRAAAVQDLDDARLQMSQVDVARQQAEKKRSLAEELAEKVRSEVERLEKAEEAATRKLAVVQREARLTRYAADIPLAHSAWQANRLDRMLNILDRHEPKAGEEDLRGFEWHYLKRLTEGARLTIGSAQRTEGKEGEQLQRPRFSPDGKILALISSDLTTIKLLDVATGKIDKTIKLPFGQAAQLAFAPDSKSLVLLQSKIAVTSGGDREKEKDCVLSRWQLPSGEPIASEDVPFTASYKTLSPDLHKVVGLNLEVLKDVAELVVWDVTTKKVQRFQFPRALLWVPAPLVVAPDNRTLAVAGSDPSRKVTLVDGAFQTPYAIYLWDLQTGEEKAVLSAHTGVVFVVAFSPDGKTLASGGQDRVIRLWDLATGKQRGTLTGHTNWVTGLSFAKDGKTLASCGRDGITRCWNVSDNTETRQFKGHRHAPWNVELAPDGKLLATAAGDVKLWDVGMRPLSRQLNTLVALPFLAAFSPDLQEIVTAQDWLDTTTWQQKPRPTSWHGRPTYSPDQRTLAVLRSENVNQVVQRVWRAVLLDAASGKERGKLEGQIDYDVALAFAPDSKTLAGRRSDKRIALWDAATGKERQLLQGKTDDVNALIFGRDGTTLITASEKKLVQIWDTATGAERSRFPGTRQGENLLALAPDGHRLAFASGPLDMVKVVDLATGKEILTLKVPSQVLHGIAFSPDGRRIATWGGEAQKSGEITLWDAATGHELLTLEQSVQVTVAAFSRDGHKLGTVMRNGVVTIWDATPLGR